MSGEAGPAALLVVAHGAANAIETLPAAAAVADVVEADVHLFRGRLDVRHAKTIGPLPILWERWYVLPRATPRPVLQRHLPAVAAALGPGVRLMLDLKGRDRRIGPAVLAATADWRARDEVIVCARCWDVADRLGGASGLRVLHSVGSRRGLRLLLARYGPGSLAGVSIHRRLLDAATVADLRRRAEWVWTWPIDDPVDARRLGAWGVTGLISDTPERLAGPRRATSTGV